MFKQLKISNFRIFDGEVTIRFRPITVLIGKNNAGKSSIIKFLLMLQQSLNLNSNAFLEANGEHVKFGKFYNLKNEGSDKTNLKFSLQINKDASPGEALRSYIENKHPMDSKKKKFNPYDENGHYEISVDVLYLGSNYAQGKSSELRLLMPIEGSKEYKEILHRSMTLYDGNRFLNFTDAEKLDMDDIEKIRQRLAEKCCVDALAQHINAIRHISPVKQDLARTIDVSANIPTDYVGKNGEYTLHHLWKFNSEENQEKYKFIRPHMKNIVDIDDIVFNTLEDLAQYNARNKKTGEHANISDFGFGVSQCLPILVQGAIMNQNTTLIVEQPEAQVHPTAQLEMSSFFADLWKKRKVRSIIETHSSNIILRLRKLVADGKLKHEDISVAFFDIENGKVTINNLDINENGTMEDGLPMEFFGADIKEGLELGKAKFKHLRGNDE